MADGTWPALRTRLHVGRARGTGLAVGVALSLVAGAAAAMCIRAVLDAAQAADRPGVLVGAAAFAVAVVTAALLAASVTRVAVDIGHEALHRLRTDAYAAALGATHVPDDTQARLTRDADAVADVLVRFAPHALGTAFRAGAGVLALALLSPAAALVGLLVVPGSWVAARWLLRRAPAVYGEVRVQAGVVTRHLTESVAGAATLRELHAERWAMDRQRRHDLGHAAAVLAGTRMRNRFYPALTVLCGAITGAVLLLVTWQASSGSVSVGTAVAAVYALGGVLVPVTQLSGDLDDLLIGRAALGRLCELLPVDPVTNPDAILDPALGIEVAGVTFAYDVDPVLHDLTLHVPPGTAHALVGASGAAKSTTLALVAGALSPGAGAVRVGGADPRTLRAGQVLLLAQHQLLIAGTVAENIALAAPDVIPKQVEHAIHGLGLRAWRAELPDGLATRVDPQAATTLDTQAIGLVRAALSGAAVLLLDEATTALDDVTEATALAHLRRGRTLLIASHRPSTLRAADRLLVLDHGRAAGHGTLSELQGSSAAYRAWLGTQDGIEVSRAPA